MNKDLLPSTSLTIDKRIEDCIYTIRCQQVMLDSDIAVFFGVETKRLNEQMKRNRERFPKDFCFKINSLEFKNLRCQNVTANPENEVSNILRSQNVTSRTLSSKRRYNPYVYTEHGIIALAGVLKSPIADKMSVVKEIVKISEE